MIAMTLLIIGMVVIFIEKKGETQSWEAHQNIGMAVLVVAVVQALLGSSLLLTCHDVS